MTRVWVIPVLPLLLASTGCSTLTPESFRAQAPPLSVSFPGPVAVTPVIREVAASHLNANGVAFEVDLNRFSEKLAALLAESLGKAGTTIGAGGGVLAVEVVYLDFMFQGPCYVDVTTTLGNGERFGQQTVGESSNFVTACRSALESAVLSIANDPRTASYLGGR